MNIGIIGGGFTGLTAAYCLAKSGHQVNLFEKEPYFGGLAWGFHRPGWDWPLEAFYHHVFTGDRDILDLVAELGLSQKILKLCPTTATQYRNSYYPLDSPAALLSFSGLNLTDKLQTGLLLGLLKINPFWKPLENYTCREIFLPLGGARAWQTIWEPLLVGKFGEYAPEISAAWLWARVKKRTPKLVYFQSGFQAIIEALVKKTAQAGAVLENQTEVRSVIPGKDHLTVTTKNRSHTFDRVLFTGPSPLLFKLLPQLPEPYVKRLNSIPHLHAQVLILETKEPILPDAYWLNVTDRSFPFLALVQHTNFIDKKYYGNHHIAYIGNYLPDGHPLLKKSSKELMKLYLPYLQKINPQLNYLQLTTYNSQLFFGPFAQPIHRKHYSRLAPGFTTPIPNLYLANMDSIYPWDRGTNYAVKLGKDAAKFIIRT